MTEETTHSALHGDPSLDNDPTDDPNKGAALGGIGGAVTGAVAGSMAGPVGTVAGALIGGIVGAVSSKAAVGAIDKVEHQILESDSALHPVALQPEPTTPSVPNPAADPAVLSIPMPDGASASPLATDETPDEEASTDRPA